MKVLVTIMVCKVLRIIGKIVGKGSSLPGKIALKICPDILERISLPKYIIAVTGSNGKERTYSTPGSKSYVMIPNESDINTARELIGRVLNG